MYEAGILYQVYKDEKYARLIKNTLMKYASMYSTLPLHPVQNPHIVVNCFGRV